MTQPITEITSTPPLFPDFAEAWSYRWMSVSLARRNIITRYTQTFLGPFWFVLQPLLLTGILTLVMGAILGAPSDGVPYVLFAGSGTVLWTTFSRSLTEVSISLVGSGAIFGKVYFPRILVPISAVMTAAADFTPVYALLLIGVFAYGLMPGWPLLMLPVFVLLTLLLALAAGLWLTVLDSYFRDTRLIVPFALQFLFYVSPIIYASSAIPERFRTLFSLNPIAGLLDAFRWSLIAGTPPPTLLEIGWVFVLGVVGLVVGLLIFARFERIIVDRI